MSAREIAIVGAGIGGLSAALALAAPGRRITLIERRTGFGEAGAGIQLSPNASRVLIRLGLGPSLARIACEPSRIAIRDLRSGRALGDVALGALANERYGAPYWFLARADLHTALLDAVRGRAEVRLKVGRSLETVTQEAGSVRFACRTEAGEVEAGEADLLVGADGLRSAARTALGDRRAPVAAGFVAYRTTVPAAAAPGRDGGLWLGPGRHVVHYPIAAGALVNVVAVERRPEALEGWSAAVEPGRVANAFRNAAPDLLAILAHAGRWAGWQLFDLPARRLSAGRIALLGDAGHAALPFAAQGAAMAIEDAAVLAAELARGDGVEAALGRYGRARLARVRSVQDLARRNARAYHAGAAVALVRNLVMARLGPEGMSARHDWLYGWGRAGG